VQQIHIIIWNDKLLRDHFFTEENFVLPKNVSLFGVFRVCRSYIFISQRTLSGFESLAKTKKEQPHLTMQLFFWQGMRDSNP